MLKELIPQRLLKSAEYSAIIQVLDSQAVKMEIATDMFFNQQFIETADVLFSLWERMWGITNEGGKALSERRKTIKAKMLGQGTTTVTAIKNVASGFGYIIDIIENFNNYKLTIKFINIVGIPANIDGLKKIIEEIKPAHLAFDFEFKYSTWGDISVKTWGVLKGKTWGEVRDKEVE